MSYDQLINFSNFVTNNFFIWDLSIAGVCLFLILCITIFITHCNETRIDSYYLTCRRGIHILTIICFLAVITAFISQILLMGVAFYVR